MYKMCQLGDNMQANSREREGERERTFINFVPDRY